MKAAGQNFIIPLVIYPFDVMLSIGETDLQLVTRLLKAGISEAEVINAKYTDHIGKARYCLFKTGQSLIRIKGKPKTSTDHSIIQHEIFHCVASIFWKMGIKLKIKTSDEAYAYLIQYLTKEIYNKI